MSILRHVSSIVHRYKRLMIELDLIDSTISPEFPILFIITKHLRRESLDVKQLEKEIKEYYGSNQSKTDTNNT